MKQYIKRVLLVLCMTVSLFSLVRLLCRYGNQGKELDPMTAMGVSQSAEGLLQNIVALDEAQAQELEATLLEDKEYGLGRRRYLLDECNERYRRIRRSDFFRHCTFRG